MSGSHIAPPSPRQSQSSSEYQPRRAARASDPQQSRASSRAASRSSSRSGGSSSGGGGAWKVWVLVIVLLIAIAALAFLLWQLFGDNITGLIGGGSSNATANVAPGIFTQVGAEYGSGKNVAGNLTISQGTQRPAEIPPEAENVVLLDISWTGKKAMSEPVYLTVSDPTFTDGDGLAVYHYNEQAASWELIGTYRIQNSSVTFQVSSLSPFAFQVISSTPQPTATPEIVATPAPTAEPTPEPTPAPIAVVDYGDYPTVQSGVFAQVDELSDDGVYVVALVSDLPATEADDAEEEEPAEEEGDGVNFSYVDDPNAAATETTGEAAAPVAAPTATVLLNKGGDTLGAVNMSLIQADDGVWCLSGPVTEGMLWTANRDYYQGDYRFSLGNNERYLNTDEGYANMILTDNSVRTRWLVQSATLADGSEVSTLNYRDNDIYYVSSLENVVETLADSLFPAGETPAEPNPLATQVTYLGTSAPADQTMLREALRFTVTKEEGQAQQLVLFQLDSDRTAPAGVVSSAASRVTVPEITQDTDLSTLDIRDGDTLLQLGVDYTIAAKVFNNSTVVVVISFMGNYSGQVVRSYPGTFFRTDGNQPTPSPEPTATPEPVQSSGGGGGGGSWVPPASSNETSSPTDTNTTYDDPTDG